MHIICRELVDRIRIEGKKLKLAQPSGKLEKIVNQVMHVHVMYCLFPFFLQRMLWRIW